jgi:VWFA-related protein
MSRLSRSAFAVFLLLGLAFAAVPAAAQRNLPAPGETIDVSIVNVDVFVTDKSGKRVTGLTPADFEIRENGIVQPITNFAEYKPDAANERLTIPFAKRTIVVFIERFALPQFRTRPVFDAIRTTLRGAVRRGDSATVIFWDNDNAYTLQDFTDQLPSLEAALTEIEQQSTGVPGSVEQMQPNAALAQTPQFSLEHMKHKANELQAIMRSISDEDGRKIVIFATSDFGLYPRGGEVRGNMLYGGVPDRGNEQYRDAVARTANEHGITMYPIYPLGLTWSSTTATRSLAARKMDVFRSKDYTVLLNQTAALRELADETGGLMAAGSAEIAALLPRVVEDLSTYYSLAYPTPATGTTRSRDIVVRAKKREYQVRSRREYVEKTDVTRMQDRVLANLFRPDRRGSIPLRVQFGALEKAGKSSWSVPLKIEVPIEALSTVEGGEGSFSVFVATGGMIGVMSEIKASAQRFSASNIPAGTKHLTYELALTFDDLARVVSVGVMDDRTKDYGLQTADLPAFSVDDLIGGQ